MPLTQDADDLRPPVLGDGVPTVVHHDKIIACPVHLPEFHDSPPSRYFLPLYRELPPLSNTLSLSPAPKRKATLKGGFSVTAHRFCCPYFHIPQGRGSVRGKPLRVSPLAFNHPPAGDHFCVAKVPHQKRRGTRTCVSSFLVRAMGLEPTRPYGHKHLKLACLPIPARSRTRYLTIIAKPGSLSSTGGKFACRR